MVAGPVARSVISSILFGKETSYGTGGTATKDIGLVKNLTINPTSNAEERHGAGQAQAVYVKGGLVDMKGSIELELQHGRPIEWALYGGTTTHAVLTGDTTHTFVWANSLPSLALQEGAELGATDLVGDYTGLLFGNSTLGVTVDGILKMSSDFTCKTIANNATSVTAAVVNTGAPLGGFEATLSLGGSAIDYVQSWEITVNRNSKVMHGAGSRAAVYGASHLANVSWKATVGFSTTTEINRLLGSASAITATEPASFAGLFVADNGIANGSGQRKLSIAMSGCQMKDYRKNIALGDFTMYDISGSGILSTATMVDQVAQADW